MLTVGPGDISEYGTGMSTPAQSSAMKIKVEASIVAVRRGMERQYGTLLSMHCRGRAVRGPLRGGVRRAARRAWPVGRHRYSAGLSAEPAFSIASRKRA
ncbi:hypothetical protein GCM10010387_41590 [Streptomyces inusitatus]|uniref:Uncharacterized protein n=1 Tax=Streptomyces inusitatus TaxID=68221 RepID=A0A918QD55_9ACTN|nr:hypothetical protein GCM10010387_41590 [Streptomyces inusitatus]